MGRVRDEDGPRQIPSSKLLPKNYSVKKIKGEMGIKTKKLCLTTGV